MYIPTPLTIGTDSEKFLIRDDSKTEGLLPLIFIILGALSIVFGLIHWYDLSLLLRGQVTTAMGVILLALATSIIGLGTSGQAKINKTRRIIVDYNYWLAEKHGLVAKETLDSGWDSVTGNAEFTDMNGDTVIHKVFVKFDHILGGNVTKMKKVPYFNLSLLPADKE